MQLKVLIALVLATLAAAAPAKVIARSDDVDSYHHDPAPPYQPPTPHRPYHARDDNVDDNYRHHHHYARDDNVDDNYRHHHYHHARDVDADDNYRHHHYHHARDVDADEHKYHHHGYHA